jgi:CBS domain-containing protein
VNSDVGAIDVEHVSKGVTAGELAARPVACCRSTDTVEQAARVMSERNVGSVVVVR